MLMSGVVAAAKVTRRPHSPRELARSKALGEKWGPIRRASWQAALKEQEQRDRT